jgi:hypothetical protein
MGCTTTDVDDDDDDNNNNNNNNNNKYCYYRDLFCGLVVRGPGYRSGGPGFDSWRYYIF